MIDDCQDMPTHPRRIRMCREIHAPDEISGYFPGAAVLDPTAKHLDLVGAAAQQVANIALEGLHWNLRPGTNFRWERRLAMRSLRGCQCGTRRSNTRTSSKAEPISHPHCNASGQRVVRHGRSTPFHAVFERSRNSHSVRDALNGPETCVRVITIDAATPEKLACPPRFKSFPPAPSAPR